MVTPFIRMTGSFTLNTVKIRTTMNIAWIRRSAPTQAKHLSHRLRPIPVADFASSSLLVWPGARGRTCSDVSAIVEGCEFVFEGLVGFVYISTVSSVFF